MSPPPLTIRRATAADAAVLAEHRTQMFLDMGSVGAAPAVELQLASEAYFRAAVPDGEYVAWLAAPAGSPGEIIAGAGVQLRSMLPRPTAEGGRLLLGREGLVLNVYVAPAWRRRGVARRLMEVILDWAPQAGIVRLTLHASDAGRALYEQLGFVATNEMRYRGDLAASGPVLGLP